MDKNDKNTKIQELKEQLIRFKNDRNWGQFHDPKNLAEAISIEAGELLELFLWKDRKKIIKNIENDKEFKKEVGEELADVIIFCLNFANSTNLDITKIVLKKITKNNKKYLVERSKNNAIKYNKL